MDVENITFSIENIILRGLTYHAHWEKGCKINNWTSHQTLDVRYVTLKYVLKPNITLTKRIVDLMPFHLRELKTREKMFT